MKEHRSLLFMFCLTVAMVLFAGVIGSLIYHVDVQPYDQHQMNGAIRYQAREMLAERTEP